VSAFVLLFAVPLSADDQAGAIAAVEKEARAALAKFEKRNGDWKARMEALVSLAKIGPPAAPVLVEALKDGPPTTREFAAQALVLFADAKTRPALRGGMNLTHRCISLNGPSMGVLADSP
jgi:HEAT repeat protein